MSSAGGRLRTERWRSEHRCQTGRSRNGVNRADCIDEVAVSDRALKPDEVAALLVK